MTTDELLSLLRAEGEDVLDDVVHETASQEASDVNNQGLEAQVDYLVEHHGWGLEAIKDFVFGR